MTARQFSTALKRHGLEWMGFAGYVRLNLPGHHTEVSCYNGGARWRDRLTYILREQDQHLAECDSGKCHHGEHAPKVATTPCDCEDAACVHVPSKCGDRAETRLVAFGCATYRCHACAEPLRLSGEVESEQIL